MLLTYFIRRQLTGSDQTCRMFASYSYVYVVLYVCVCVYAHVMYKVKCLLLRWLKTIHIRLHHNKIELLYRSSLERRNCLEMAPEMILTKTVMMVR